MYLPGMIPSAPSDICRWCSGAFVEVTDQPASGGSSQVDGVVCFRSSNRMIFCRVREEEVWFARGVERDEVLHPFPGLGLGSWLQKQSGKVSITSWSKVRRDLPPLLLLPTMSLSSSIGRPPPRSPLRTTTHTGGKVSWKPVGTSWVHCRLWIIFPPMYSPITSGVHPECNLNKCPACNHQ